MSDYEKRKSIFSKHRETPTRKLLTKHNLYPFGPETPPDKIALATQIAGVINAFIDAPDQRTARQVLKSRAALVRSIGASDQLAKEAEEIARKSRKNIQRSLRRLNQK